MNATLTFEKDEKTQLLLALHAREIATEVSELSVDIRSWVKHGHSFKTIEEALEHVRERLPMERINECYEVLP